MNYFQRMLKKADDDWEKTKKAKTEEVIENTKATTNSTIMSLEELRALNSSATPVQKFDDNER